MSNSELTPDQQAIVDRFAEKCAVAKEEFLERMGNEFDAIMLDELKAMAHRLRID